jgi:hypothetical protein
MIFSLQTISPSGPGWLAVFGTDDLSGFTNNHCDSTCFTIRPPRTVYKNFLIESIGPEKLLYVFFQKKFTFPGKNFLQGKKKMAGGMLPVSGWQLAVGKKEASHKEEVGREKTQRKEEEKNRRKEEIQPVLADSKHKSSLERAKKTSSFNLTPCKDDLEKVPDRGTGFKVHQPMRLFPVSRRHTPFCFSHREREKRRGEEAKKRRNKEEVCRKKTQKIGLQSSFSFLSMKNAVLTGGPVFGDSCGPLQHHSLPVTRKRMP